MLGDSKRNSLPRDWKKRVKQAGLLHSSASSDDLQRLVPGILFSHHRTASLSSLNRSPIPPSRSPTPPSQNSTGSFPSRSSTPPNQDSTSSFSNRHSYSSDQGSDLENAAYPARSSSAPPHLSRMRSIEDSLSELVQSSLNIQQHFDKFSAAHIRLLKQVAGYLYVLKKHYDREYRQKFSWFSYWVQRKGHIRIFLGSDEKIELLQSLDELKINLKKVIEAYKATGSPLKKNDFNRSSVNLPTELSTKAIAQTICQDILAPLITEREISIPAHFRQSLLPFQAGIDAHNAALQQYMNTQENIDENIQSIQTKELARYLHWYDLYKNVSVSKTDKKKIRRHMEENIIVSAKAKLSYVWHAITNRRDKYFRKQFEKLGHVVPVYTGLGYFSGLDRIATNSLAEVSNQFLRRLRQIKLNYVKKIKGQDPKNYADWLNFFENSTQDFLEIFWDPLLEQILFDAIKHGEKVDFSLFSDVADYKIGTVTQQTTDQTIIAKVLARDTIAKPYNEARDHFYADKYDQVTQSFDYVIHHSGSARFSKVLFLFSIPVTLGIFSTWYAWRHFTAWKKRHERCSSVVNFLIDFETLLHNTPRNETQSHGLRLIEEFKRTFFHKPTRLTAEQKYQLLNAWHRQLIEFLLDLQEKARMEQVKISLENLKSFKRHINHISEELQLKNCLVRDSDNLLYYKLANRQILERTKILDREHKHYVTTTAETATPIVAFTQGGTAVWGWLSICVTIGLCALVGSGGIAITALPGVVISVALITLMGGTFINNSLFKNDFKKALRDLFIDYGEIPFFVPGSMKDEATWVKVLTGVLILIVLVGAFYSAGFVFNGLMTIFIAAGLTASLASPFGLGLAGLAFLCFVGAFFVAVSKSIKNRYHLRLAKFLGVTFLPFIFDGNWMRRNFKSKCWFCFKNIFVLVIGGGIIYLVYKGNLARFRTWAKISADYIKNTLSNNAAMQHISTVLCAVAAGLWFIFGARRVGELCHRFLNRYIGGKLLGRVKPKPILALDTLTLAAIDRQLLLVENQGKDIATHGIKIPASDYTQNVVEAAEQYALRYPRLLRTFRAEGFHLNTLEHSDALNIILKKIAELAATAAQPALTQRIDFVNAHLANIIALTIPAQIDTLHFDACQFEATHFARFIQSHPQIKYLSFDQASFSAIHDDCKNFALNALRLENFIDTTTAVKIHPETKNIEFENVPAALVYNFSDKNKQITSLNLKNIYDLDFHLLFQHFSAKKGQLVLHQLSSKDAENLMAQLQSLPNERFLHLHLVGTSKKTLNLLKACVRHSNKRILLTTPKGDWHASQTLHTELAANPAANYASPFLRKLTRWFGYAAALVNAVANAFGYAAGGNISIEDRALLGGSAFFVSLTPNYASFSEYLADKIKPLQKEQAAMVANDVLTNLNAGQPARAAIVKQKPASSCVISDGLKKCHSSTSSQTMPDNPHYRTATLELPGITLTPACVQQTMQAICQQFLGSIKQAETNRALTYQDKDKAFQVTAIKKGLRLHCAESADPSKATIVVAQMAQKIIQHYRRTGQPVIACVRGGDPFIKQQLETALRQANVPLGNYEKLVQDHAQRRDRCSQEALARRGMFAPSLLTSVPDFQTPPAAAPCA